MTGRDEASSVTARLAGGLGNQLFQYAAARSVAERERCGVRVDARYLGSARPGETPRSFALEWLVPPDSVVLGTRTTTGLRGRIARRLPQRDVFSEHGFAYDPRVLEVHRGMTIVGYFQSWRYFDSIADLLRSDLLAAAPRSPWYSDTLAQLQAAGPWCAVHVRRGDYLTPHNSAYHGVLTPDYYRQALERLGSTSSQRLVVFSDDPEGGAAVLGRSAASTMVLRPPHEAHPMESIALMSHADSIITANSSFSWWGAWLAGAHARVVSPEPWLSGAGLDERDLRPPGWLTAPSGFVRP